MKFPIFSFKNDVHAMLCPCPRKNTVERRQKFRFCQSERVNERQRDKRRRSLSGKSSASVKVSELTSVNVISAATR